MLAALVVGWVISKLQVDSGLGMGYVMNGLKKPAT